MFGKSHLVERNGLEAVELSSHDGLHRVEVYLHGATIGSWMKNGEERLYLSSKAVFDGAKALRGGVPLVFPQFARPDQSMPQHGFIRTSKWTYIGSLHGDDSVTAFFRLTRDEVNTTWSHQFVSVYEVTLTSEALQYSLRVYNTDLSEFSFQALLHTYLRVPRIEEVRVKGLKSWDYFDKVDGNNRKSQEDPIITIDREVDRVYVAGSCSTHPGGSPVLVNIDLHESRFVSSQSYAVISSFDRSIVDSVLSGNVNVFDSVVRGVSGESLTTDVVVWNAWEEKSRALDDLDDDAYFHYICIEPGLVSSSHILKPNHFITLIQKIY